MKPRKKPSQRMRALLQKEIDSCCPFCGSHEVDTFEVHHINDNPDDDTFNNEIMVCPTCHAKITVGTIPRNDVYRKKYELVEASKGRERQEQGTTTNISMKDVDVGIVGNNNRVTTKTVKKQIIKYPLDCIGSDSAKANYISYLIDRYNKFASWQRNDFKYPAFNTHLKKRFKVGPQRTVYNIPLTRFDELVEYIQQRITDTRLGRIKKKTQGLFESFSEYCSEHS